MEEQFYLTWPWIEKYVRAAPRNRLLVVLILIVVANQLGQLLWLFPEAGLPHRIIWYIAPSILLGVLSARVMHDRRGFAIVNAALGWLWSAPAVLAVLAVLAVIALLLSVPMQNQAWEMVISASLVALVLSCTAREDDALAKLLPIKPLVRMIRFHTFERFFLHFKRRYGAAVEADAARRTSPAKA